MDEVSSTPGPVRSTESDQKITISELKVKVSQWTKKLKAAATLVAVPGPDNEPFKNVYVAIEKITVLHSEVDQFFNLTSVSKDPVLTFWTKFAKIHILSSLAKWNEICEELTSAEKNHIKCIDIIEEEIRKNDELESPEELVAQITVSEESDTQSDVKRGKERVQYMYIYELTRYAILCSERDNQDKALNILKKAETFYHDNNVKESLRPLETGSILEMLDSLNSESSKDLFTYVLFYIGQAYKINGEKEKAILYLHMVLRRQLEKGDFNNVTWGSDSSRMASVLMVNAQAFETARNILVAATAVMRKTPEEEKSSDNFKQNWADLGRTWTKFAVHLLEASCDRLKDLEEQTRPPVKFESRMVFTKYEKLSLEINEDVHEHDSLLLIRSLKFPTLDVSEVEEVEMKGRFVRDFDEARAVFLPAQHWTTIAKEYYNLDEFAGDYVDLMTDYASTFKYLAFFEPSIDRQVKMHKRRVHILEEVLAALNSKIYADVFHYILRDLAESYETIYKLKVDECKDRGKSLRPKDQRLVQWLTDAVNAHKRNLQLFDFDIANADKNFPNEYEKILLGCVLSMARILGSICHDHPLHSDAIRFGEDSKSYYKYFLEYLERRTELKREFQVLFDASLDMPELLESQIRKIKHHRMRRAIIQSEG